MRQSVLKFILHQPTPDAIVAQVECLECLARLEAADNALDGLLADFVSLQVDHHDLSVAHGPDDLCHSVVCEAVLRKGHQADVTASGPQAFAEVDSVHVAERAIREVQVTRSGRLEERQQVAFLLGRDSRLLYSRRRG